MEFSKWNKRITIWLLLGVGFYMGLTEYTFVYFITFLGTGLTAMGIAVWGGINTKAPDNPPPILEQHDPEKTYYAGNRVAYDNKEWEALTTILPGSFSPNQWEEIK